MRSAQTQLDRVDAIAVGRRRRSPPNASALSTTVASTFGGPLVKVAAFGYGVRAGQSAAARPTCPAKPSRRTVIVGPHRAVRAAPAKRGRRTDAAMFRRTFWFTAGAAAGVWATTKVNREAKQLTPESLAARAADKAIETGAPAQGRSPSTSAAGMAQREAELQRRAGPDTAPGPELPQRARRERRPHRHATLPAARAQPTHDALVQPE